VELRSLKDIGLYIRSRRQELGMSQTTLCDLSGTLQPWLSSLEQGKGNPTILPVLDVLRVLNLTFELSPGSRLSVPVKTRRNGHGLDTDSMDEPKNLVGSLLQQRAVRTNKPHNGRGQNLDAIEQSISSGSSLLQNAREASQETRGKRRRSLSEHVQRHRGLRDDD